MSAPHPTPAGSEERPADATQPAPSAELSDERIDAIAIRFAGRGGRVDYRAFARAILATATQPAPSAEPLTNEGAIHPLAGEPLQLLIVEVARMRRALDAIYGHNEAARAAVAQHYGLHHKDISLLVDVLRRKFAAATQGAPTPAQADIARQWREAYAAFKGAFDTPQMRRHMGDEYSQDARKRLRDFDEAFVAAGDAGKTGESAASPSPSNEREDK